MLSYYMSSRFEFIVVMPAMICVYSDGRLIFAFICFVGSSCCFLLFAISKRNLRLKKKHFYASNMNKCTLWILCINIPCCITFACIKHDNVTFCLYLASYIGCFKDDENRMFDDRRTDSNAMTVDMCISDCRTRHSVYSGVQVCLEHLLDILHLIAKYD